MCAAPRFELGSPAAEPIHPAIAGGEEALQPSGFRGALRPAFPNGFFGGGLAAGFTVRPAASRQLSMSADVSPRIGGGSAGAAGRFRCGVR